MLRKALILILVMAPFSTASAAALDLRLGSKMAEVNYMMQDATFGYGGADMSMGVFLNENDDLLATGSILVSGSSAGDVKGLHFGVGAKVYTGILNFPSPDENQEGAAIAIGAQARYIFAGKTPMAILIEGFYAPSVTSLSDFEGTTEIRLAFELEVTPSARAYVGYRSLDFDLNNRIDRELDDKVHVGVRFAF